MAWHKTSAEAGLAGLESWEAARGVMLVPEFQHIPDPLDPPKGSFLLVSVYSNIILHSTVSKVLKQVSGYHADTPITIKAEAIHEADSRIH